MPFQTKPELALAMLARALAAGVPAGWVAGDEVYGQHAGLRLASEERGMPHVLAMPVNQYTIAALHGRIGEARVDALLAAVPGTDWARLSAGNGAKGPGRTTKFGCRSARCRSPTGTGCSSAAT